MIDQTIIGRLTAELMEDMETSYGDQAELIRAMVIVEVRYPDEEDVQRMHTTITWNDTDRSVAAKVGLLVTALKGLLS